MAQCTGCSGTCCTGVGSDPCTCYYDDRGDEPPGVGVPVRKTVAEAIVYHENCPRCGAVLCDSEEEPISMGEHVQATGCGR